MGDRSPKDAEKRKKKAASQKAAKGAKPSQAAPPRPDIIVKSPKSGR